MNLISDTQSQLLFPWLEVGSLSLDLRPNFFWISLIREGLVLVLQPLQQRGAGHVTFWSLSPLEGSFWDVVSS